MLDEKVLDIDEDEDNANWLHFLVQKSIDGHDATPLNLPPEFLDQLPTIFEDTEMVEVSEEVMKGLANIAGKVLQTFKGRAGRWITTHTGRKIFIFAEDASSVERLATAKLGPQIKFLQGSAPGKFISKIEGDGVGLFKPDITRIWHENGKYEFKAVKAMSGIASSVNEPLAYEINKALGMDLVPPAISKVVDGQVGAFIQLVPGRAGYKTYPAKYWIDRKAPPEMTEDFVLKAAAFDWILNNADRNAGNFVKSTTGRWWLIDHTDTMATDIVDHMSVFTTSARHNSYSLKPLLEWENKWPEVEAAIRKAYGSNADIYVTGQNLNSSVKARFDVLMHAAKKGHKSNTFLDTAFHVAQMQGARWGRDMAAIDIYDKTVKATGKYGLP